MNLAQTATRLEALGNPTRLEICRLLVRAGPDGMPVGEIQRRTDVPRSTLSHHLHRLIGVGLVTQERQATTLICRANYRAMNETLGSVCRVLRRRAEVRCGMTSASFSLRGIPMIFGGSLEGIHDRLGPQSPARIASAELT